MKNCPLETPYALCQHQGHGGAEAPTTEQKAELIQGVTDLLVRVLGKNPATTVVVIDEVPMENWGIGGAAVACRRQQRC